LILPKSIEVYEAIAPLFMYPPALRDENGSGDLIYCSIEKYITLYQRIWENLSWGQEEV
jgi:hypothetical protein